MGMLASFGVGSTILGAFSDKFGRKKMVRERSISENIDKFGLC